MPKDSPLKSVADLKGKNVALNKGSNVHYLLVKALEKAGVAYSDVQVSFLPPADARAAFEKGAVDAWVIWEPFLSAAEVATGARQLANGNGLVDNHEFYLASRDFLDTRIPTWSTPSSARSTRSTPGSTANSDDVAEQFAPALGIPEDVLKIAVAAPAIWREADLAGCRRRAAEDRRRVLASSA